VPLIDPRTNLIDRAWYMFFLSLLGAATTIYETEDLGPSAESLIASYDAALQALAQNVDTQPLPVDLSAELIKQIQAADLADCCSGLLSQIAEMQKQIEGLQVQPQFDAAAITAAIAATSTAPVTKTADFTLASNETWVINNKSGSTCVVTLPAASAWSGREVTFKNMQAQLLNSASSNVVPIDSTTAGTAILLNVIGNWATMVSDGTNWVIMQAASNNNLLLE
jgi:hypothetical protein